eukprot:TRINITY_DN1691_c0_g1_i1.p1 TRINITY_DN1691_c0_g1~~TRINITY_DN1691_c0_g1_i1.p1  ORF type:complete len:220 (+),score=56.48 TRINITY_DN1691_c0_g1_i1:154-813(+)
MGWEESVSALTHVAATNSLVFFGLHFAAIAVTSIAFKSRNGRYSSYAKILVGFFAVATLLTGRTQFGNFVDIISSAPTDPSDPLSSPQLVPSAYVPYQIVVSYFLALFSLSVHSTLARPWFTDDDGDKDDVSQLAMAFSSAGLSIYFLREVAYTFAQSPARNQLFLATEMTGVYPLGGYALVAFIFTAIVYTSGSPSGQKKATVQVKKGTKKPKKLKTK